MRAVSESCCTAGNHTSARVITVLLTVRGRSPLARYVVAGSAAGSTKIHECYYEHQAGAVLSATRAALLAALTAGLRTALLRR